MVKTIQFNQYSVNIKGTVIRELVGQELCDCVPNPDAKLRYCLVEFIHKGVKYHGAWEVL